ncbi:MAG: T9SS type A sorting domain-containing protein [bacterium]|nr:T9SS type A sorting domain-containing protein [bacterium]
MKTTITTISLFLFVLFSFGQTTVSTLVDNSATPFTDDIIEDASGNLYCADYSGDAVFKRTPSGTVTTFVSGLNTPNGLAFNSSGELYVCDNIGSRIYVYDALGSPLDTITVTNPSGIIKDIASDTMIFTTYGSVSELKKLSPDGFVFDFHAGGELNGPVGLEYCLGELYVANFDDRKIFRVESDTVIFVTQLPGSGRLGFIANAGDRMLATAFNGQKVYSIDPISEEVNIYAGSTFGGTDGSLDSAQFTTPNGVYVNATMDSIYVSEYNTGKLRLISGFTLGTSELSFKTALNIYPNPTAGEFTIEYEKNDVPCTVSICSLDGKIVDERNLNSELETFKNLNLRSGTYSIRIKANGIILAQERLVCY